MITVLHLRQGAGLYGAARAVLAQATAPPFSAMAGSLQAPGGPDALERIRPEAVRRGMARRAQERARSDDAQAMASSYSALYSRARRLSPMPSSSR